MATEDVVTAMKRHNEARSVEVHEDGTVRMLACVFGKCTMTIPR